jgi:YD repeat-containing protein
LESIDPAGSVTRTEVDDAGRTTKTIRNFGGSVTETVRTEFNSLGQMSKQIAENVDTGDQETVYSYGVSLADSDLASGAMLRQLTHPDSGTVVYAYDRAGQQTSMTDPNGSVHQYDYDAAGRRVADTVSTLGSGVDGGVRRIEHAFDNRMRLEKVTSFDAVTGGSIESEIQYQYNEFGQLIKEYQQHGAAVDVSTSPVVEYDFEDGSANTIRARSIVYPDGRQLDYQYGTVGSEADLLDRVETIEDGAMTLVTYQRSGGTSNSSM